MPSPAPARETIRSVLAKSEEWFAARGVNDPRRSAQLLLAHALDKDRLTLLLDADRPLTEGELAPFRALVRRRGAGEPVAYILGEWEFYGLPFRVGPGVLVPRPETEGIVDAARATFAPDAPLRFADLGTGSGCLAVTLAAQFPAARGVAVDLSPDALALARANAAANNVADRIDFLQADFGRLPDAPGLKDACCDLVVANPPYVTEDEYAALSREVANFEPRGALLAGPDGLDAVRALLPQARRLLRPGGLFLMEIGYRQGDAASALTTAAGLGSVRVLRDLAGHQRIVRAQG